MNPAHTSSQPTTVPTACKDKISLHLKCAFTFEDLSSRLSEHQVKEAWGLKPEALGMTVDKHLHLGHLIDLSALLLPNFPSGCPLPRLHTAKCVSPWAGFIGPAVFFPFSVCVFPSSSSFSKPNPFPVRTHTTPHSHRDCHRWPPQFSPQLSSSVKPLLSKIIPYSCTLGIFVTLHEFCWGKISLLG